MDLLLVCDTGEWAESTQVSALLAATLTDGILQQILGGFHCPDSSTAYYQCTVQIVERYQAGDDGWHAGYT